jgi:hypothetical protein
LALGSRMPSHEAKKAFSSPKNLTVYEGHCTPWENYVNRKGCKLSKNCSKKPKIQPCVERELRCCVLEKHNNNIMPNRIAIPVLILIMKAILCRWGHVLVGRVPPGPASSWGNGRKRPPLLAKTLKMHYRIKTWSDRVNHQDETGSVGPQS